MFQESQSNWSYPMRRVGHRVLSDIPLEIYEEIISYIKPSKNPSNQVVARERRRRRMKDLCSLSLVCRFLRAILFPLISETLFFQTSILTRCSERVRRIIILYPESSSGTYLRRSFRMSKSVSFEIGFNTWLTSNVTLPKPFCTNAARCYHK
ncbi:hypothetical protein GYMLUDRAFT_705308 [Collybiopsis luxurians FD-317 M1]|uniref:Unplaced genomic scaffold GYMLUscaffold_39, whole genome shotgun sequence n=1 Tax=Collybiopsis luxurians FD-317 M1 TaxID=944289 RepID=A0A0D0BS18_9AGAR|nr:hypothetical protein GYMLUDRAFT_705308 [Collybiopsis luxurians FD-317 M1]